MANITSDAMKIALQLQIEGEAEVVASLNRVNTQINNAKAAAAQADFNMQQMKLEGRFDPDKMRRYEIAQLDELMQKYKLSAEFRKAAMDEIHAKHARAIRDLEEERQAREKTYLQVSGVGNPSGQQDAASREFVAERARLAREVERIEEQSLSNLARLHRRYEEIRSQRRSGLIDQSQTMALAREARAEYDAAVAKEAKILKAKQDSDDKQVASERAKVQKIIATIRSQQYQSREAERLAAIKAEAAARREAEAIMNKWGTAAESAARDIAVLNTRLADGTISATEHAAAINNINNKMAQMAGGAGRMGFMVGNLATGMEDFVTVISMTGFGMEGFSAATRAASNNVGQAVRSLGTGTAAMLAPMVSIGVVLAGFAIPAAYRWIVGAEDAAKATEKWGKELEKLIKLFNSLSFDLELLEIDRFSKSLEIDDIKSLDEIDKQIKNALFEMSELEVKIRKAMSNAGLTAQQMWDHIIPPDIESDFNSLSNALGNALGPEVATDLENRMKAIREQFLEDAKHDGERAAENLEENMRRMADIVEEYRRKVGEGTSEQKIKFFNETAGLADIEYLFAGNKFYDDAAIVDRIQAMKEEIVKLEGKETEEARQLTQELETQVMLFEQMLEKRQEILKNDRIWKEGLDFGAEIENKNELENGLEMLNIQHKKNRLLGDEQEAERRLLDLALRRREILESGLMAPNKLEEMFNAELEAIAADVEKKLFKLNEIVGKTDTASEAEAYAAANKMIIEASSKDSTEEKEMVQLLTAIRDHLANRQLLNVEVQ